jgi:hypothetical protein
MHPFLILVVKVCAGAAAFVLFAYVLYRCVVDAKKRAGRASLGGQLMATALTLFSGTALDPAREVATEARKLKRNQDGSGDPESDDAQDGA